uniref:Uncharacterized protein n=1 Tax=Parascaris equorum TaxID=6256 RepID=A0A914S1S7_PAREQ
PVVLTSVAETVYIPYKKEEWSPLYLYRTLGDLTAAVMRQSGAEGVGRVEVGRTYGIDTMVKAGNRRVSVDAQPERFKALFTEWERVSGEPCPFTIGQVIKFPKTNLTYFFKVGVVLVGDLQGVNSVLKRLYFAEFMRCVDIFSRLQFPKAIFRLFSAVP